jgi:hypothetical protein
MDKAKNHKPAKLQSQDKAARVAAAKAEVLEAAERFAASWRQSNPLPPTAAELAKRRAEVFLVAPSISSVPTRQPI